MIDTDKYEGHTPTEWMREMTLNGLYSHILQTCTHPQRWLIEDAPLLLAEVKRLREEVNTLNEIIDTERKKVYDIAQKLLEVIE